MMTPADVELLEQFIDGTLADGDAERLRALLRDSAEAREMLRSLATIDIGLQDIAATADADSRGSLREPIEDEHTHTILSERTAALWTSRTTKVMGALLAVATLLIVTLSATLYFRRPSAERAVEETTAQRTSAGQPIAKITGLSGPLQWTGDGGQVDFDMRVGAELAGGTVEGLVPGSWFELTFSDGSTATISGNSMLTVSDQGQKKLHLKAGNLSGKVEPQPPGKPMLIYTPSALLEVVGTQFEIEAETVATVLNVSEGNVRVTRFSDGNTVDVPARHRVIAAADREMLPELVPNSVSHWRSELPLGPVGTQGKWSPETDTQAATLRAIPYTSPQGMTIYTTGLGVSRGAQTPVTLQPNSSLRVRGSIASPHKMYFGVTVRRASGEFAGRFQTSRPAGEFRSGENFEVIFHLEDFGLDPSLDERKDKLPTVPFGLVVASVWCHTLDKQAGLEITEVEFGPSHESSIGIGATGPSQWTRARQTPET